MEPEESLSEGVVEVVAPSLRAIDDVGTTGESILCVVDEPPPVDEVVTAVRSGTSVVMSSADGAELGVVLRLVSGGFTVLPRELMRCVGERAAQVRACNELTETERAALQAVADERRVSEIARDLNYSERTIRRHLRRAYAKLGVSTRPTAVAVALRSGIVEDRLIGRRGRSM
ncbi:MAG: LuxR C-terminal-related transcriptional regulator [Actinomycetota bacterium]